MLRIADVLVRAGAAAGFLMMVSLGAAPAKADCFEVIGCTNSDWFDSDDLEEFSCENLWHVRNRIYDEHGYCFSTARGREYFDNSDCWINDQTDVELSEIETHNVDEIVEVEEENGCE
jgi:hypothetical protein